MKSYLTIFLLTIFTCISTITFAQRQKILIDFNWKFRLGDVEQGQSTDLSDSDWRILNLPHDWSVEGEFSEDAPGGGRVGYLPTGIGWYRKTFTLPSSSKGKEVSIDFDGVYMNSDVWINGHHLAHRPNGYISFSYDLTPYLQDGNNTIAVRVDNSQQPNSRWYSGSGIYRHVWLTITQPLKVAQWGTYITTPEITENLAKVHIRTTIKNNDTKTQKAILQSIIFNENYQEVARTESPVNAESNTEQEIVQDLQVNNPQLWSIETPVLYTLRTVIMDEKKIVDQYDTPFGIREIEYDAVKGFFLNGQHVKMKGVCLHHGGGSVGAAVPERVWERRFEKLKTMGCNAIRTSHNPMATEFLDLCDRMGFLVMDEIYDEWTHGKVEHGYNKYFEEWSQKDLVDFIHRDRNHPSVVMWSAGNEIGEQSVEGGHEILKPLLETFRQEDPTRPVTTGNDHIAADGRTATVEFLNMLDIVGYNYMDRWHERRELYASQDKHDYPDWKLVGTESGSVWGGRGNYSLGDDPEKVRPNYTSGMIRAEQLWKFVSMHDYIIGDFMWTGIDYLGEARWPSKNASSGTMDLCGFEKDSYYFYQSQWTEKHVLHLFPHWDWKGREGQFLPVLAYTNCDSVELFLNGKSIGVKSLEFPRQGTSGGWNSYERPYVRTTTVDLHLSWDVPYEPGTIKAVGKKDGKVVIEKEIQTTGEPAAIKLSVDRDRIKSDLNDVAHVKVEIVDDQGRVVPIADNLVQFTISGSGKLIGADNGKPTDHDSFKVGQRKAYNGLALAIIQSNGKEGSITVKATSDGLKSDEIKIEASKDVKAVFNYEQALK